MIALLTGAVMFALGLFFGWLLHRERVERALYEDAVRARDRANTTLAETAARLELADKDMIRLREQLTEAQHRVEERDAAIAELEAELESERERARFLMVGESAERDVDRVGASEDVGDLWEAPAARSPRRSTGGRVTAGPPDARLFDDLDLDGEIDITEEVAVPPPADQSDAADGDAVDDGSADADAVEGGAAEGVAVEPVAVVDAVDDGSADADTVEGGAAEDVAAEGDAAEGGAAEGGAAEDVAVEPVAVEWPDATAATVDDAHSEPDATGAVSPGGAPSDDLQQISGVGPALERLLRDQGITTFRQLASLDDAAIDELQSRSPRLASRLRRGSWVSQARRLHIDAHGDEP